MPYTIEEIKSKLTPIFENKGVTKAIIFGSYARGEATDESDIDIAAHVSEEMSILDFCGIADDVINGLGKDVDFIYANDIVPGGKMDSALQEDGVLIYAKAGFGKAAKNKDALQK